MKRFIGGFIFGMLFMFLVVWVLQEWQYRSIMKEIDESYKSEVKK